MANDINHNPGCRNKMCYGGVMMDKSGGVVGICKRCNPEYKKPTVRDKTSVLALMKFMQAGQEFYIDEEPKQVTAYASLHQMRVTTERCYGMTQSDPPIVKKITRVTIAAN